MNISSPAFEHSSHMPKVHSYTGGNVSPPLTFSNIPTEAKSLALVCHDPDAPRAQGYTHWVVWNIPPNTKRINAGELPQDSTVGMYDFNTTVWGGPAPPSGTHRYNFYVYALDTMLELPVSTNREMLELAMEGHIIEKALLTGMFSAE